MSRAAPILAWLAAVCLVSAASPAATAEFDAKDCQILGRTLGYVGDGMTGPATVGVVFVPGDVASEQEAEHVRMIIGDGVTTGRIKLQVRPVPVGELATATGLAALYLTPGLTDKMDAVFAAARRLRVPTIAADLGCVEAGRCVIGFISEPTVQILINQGAAERIGVHFLQAFRMLVREK